MAKLGPINQEQRIAFDIMEAVAKAEAAEPRRKYLGMSSIGGECERALWYGFRGFDPIPFPGRVLRIFEAGDDGEKRMIRDLTRTGFQVTNTQAEYSDFDGMFRGHSDGKIHGVTKRGGPEVLECKTANDRIFKLFCSDGCQATNYKYFCQGQCYMGYSGLTRCFFIVENKNTSDLYIERLYFDPLLFAKLKAKAARIIYANEAPAKLPKKADCKYCDFRLLCLDGAGVQMSETCGTCWYFGWIPGLAFKKQCFHPNHPYELTQWGATCGDWLYLCAKDAPGKPRVEKLTLEQLPGDTKAPTKH
jgi:hypothetical protein